MAIVRGPLQSIQASGSMGALNFTRWRGTAVVRARATPTIPNTAKQVVMQGYLSGAIVDWTTILTEDQREMWRKYAKTQRRMNRLGEWHEPTAYNLYISFRIRNLHISGPILLEPPPNPPPNFRFALLVTGNPTGTLVLWRLGMTTGPPEWDRAEGWAAGPFTSQARHPIEPDWRFVAYQLPSSNVVLATTPERWYWVKSRLAMLNGHRGSWVWEQRYTQVT